MQCKRVEKQVVLAIWTRLNANSGSEAAVTAGTKIELLELRKYGEAL